MLIVRGVNVFPSAVREVVGAFAPNVSGHIRRQPADAGVKQEPPLPVAVELARDATPTTALADAIRERTARRARRPDARRARAVGNAAAQRVQVQLRGTLMRKLQSQGVHHITIVGADRQTSIDFWEGVLGMPFVFEQPNLDNEAESHLYFDPGDGRLITIFTNEERAARPEAHRDGASAASTTSPSRSRRRRSIRRSSGSTSAASATAASRTAASWTRSTSTIRSGCWSSSRRTASSRRSGFTHADVLLEAHKLRVERGDYNIAQEHLADAIESLVARRAIPSPTIARPKDPYRRPGGVTWLTTR